MISPAMGFSVLRAEAILDFPGNFQLDQLSASVRFGWADPPSLLLLYSVIFLYFFILSPLHLLSLSPDSSSFSLLNYLSSSFSPFLSSFPLLLFPFS